MVSVVQLAAVATWFRILVPALVATPPWSIVPLSSVLVRVPFPLVVVRAVLTRMILTLVPVSIRVTFVFTTLVFRMFSPWMARLGVVGWPVFPLSVLPPTNSDWTTPLDDGPTRIRAN